MEKKFHEFKPTSWAIDNKTSVYVLAVIIAVFGIFSYRNIPKEQIPEIVIPYIIVNTFYPGTSPADIENLVTRPLEVNLKSISGVKVINSISVQDFSSRLLLTVYAPMTAKVLQCQPAEDQPPRPLAVVLLRAQPMAHLFWQRR